MREAEIIALLSQKDPQGAESLLKHFGPLMCYVIRPILPNTQDQEECLSEAVLRIMDKIHLYNPDRGSWKAWITAVTRSVALNKARANSHLPEAEELTAQTPSPERTPEEHLLYRERSKELMYAISLLSPKDRLLFYRKYYYLQATAQIASETGMTERAIEGRLYRIKRHLRKLLGGEDNGRT